MKHEHKYITVDIKEGKYMVLKCGCGKKQKLSLDVKNKGE